MSDLVGAAIIVLIGVPVVLTLVFARLLLRASRANRQSLSGTASRGRPRRRR